MTGFPGGLLMFHRPWRQLMVHRVFDAVKQESKLDPAPDGLASIRSGSDRALPSARVQVWLKASGIILEDHQMVPLAPL